MSLPAEPPATHAYAAALFVLLTCLAWSTWTTRARARPAQAPPAAPARTGAPPAAALLFGEPLDLNAASATDLAALPGIGETRATDILEHRRELGCFDTIADLRAVPGIGAKTFARLKPLVRVGPCSPERAR